MTGFVKITTIARKLLSNKRGSIALAFGATLPVIALVAAVAVDYTNLVRQRSDLQNFLDAALVDSIWVNGYENAKKTLKDRFSIDPDFSNTIITKLNLEENPDGTVKLIADVKLNAPLLFGGILGYETLPVSVSSAVSAAKTLTDVKFEPISAKGWFPKKVELIVRRPDTGEEDVLSTMYYRVRAKKSICRRKGKLVLTDCGELELGDYDLAYLRFSVWELNADIRNQRQNPPSITIRSDDPANARRFFIDDVQKVDGTSVDVFSGLECDESSKHAWEDQRVVSLGDSRDFVYRVTGFCKNVDPTKVVFVK